MYQYGVAPDDASGPLIFAACIAPGIAVHSMSKTVAFTVVLPMAEVTVGMTSYTMLSSSPKAGNWPYTDNMSYDCKVLPVLSVLRDDKENGQLNSPVHKV